MPNWYYTYYPFFGQESPQADIIGMVASQDESEPYELDAAAVFSCRYAKWLVVIVSGCSCWPSRGTTEQHVCHSKIEVTRVLAGSKFDRLVEMCQQVGWGATTVEQPDADD